MQRADLLCAPLANCCSIEMHDGFPCRVLILQRGRVVYFGDNGDAATAYFMQTLPEVGLDVHRYARPSSRDLARGMSSPSVVPVILCQHILTLITAPCALSWSETATDRRNLSACHASSG